MSNLPQGIYEALLDEELNSILRQHPELRSVFGKLDLEEERLKKKRIAPMGWSQPGDHRRQQHLLLALPQPDSQGVLFRHRATTTFMKRFVVMAEQTTTPATNRS